MKNYVFQGDVIRLCDAKYPRLVEQFPNINVLKELEIIDLAFSENPPKSWWMPMIHKLGYQDRMAEERKGRYEKQSRESLIQRVERKSKEKVAAIEAAEHSMDPNDSPLWLQMDQH